MKSYSKYLAIIICCVAVFASCTGDKAAALKPLDLLSYGFPVTIMAPDSADVEKSSMGIIDEVTIAGKGNYGMLVQSSMVTLTDEKAIKQSEMDMVKDGRYFSKVIKENEKGFMYETVIDSVNFNYEFFYVRIQGDKEFIFRTPYDHSFTEDEVARVYDSLVEGQK